MTNAIHPQAKPLSGPSSSAALQQGARWEGPPVFQGPHVPGAHTHACGSGVWREDPVGVPPFVCLSLVNKMNLNQKQDKKCPPPPRLTFHNDLEVLTKAVRINIEVTQNVTEEEII